MLCSSTSHDQHPSVLPRYPGGPSSGAGYLIHPAAAAAVAAAYSDGLQHDYALFGAPDAAAGPVVNYVQDQCSIHSSAACSNPPAAGLAFPHSSVPSAHLIPPSGKKFWEQSGQSSIRASASAADSAASQTKSQQPARTNGRAFYRAGGAAATSTSAAGPKKRKRVATVAQRRAANIRERRRMFNLNEAFDKLRRKVPTFAYEKRLSRIETLRLAITYISFMDQVIRNEGSPVKSSSSLSVAGAQSGSGGGGGSVLGALPSVTESAMAASMAASMATDAGAHRRRHQIDAHFRESSSMAPASICW